MEPTRLPRCFIPLMYGRALVIKYLFTGYSIMGSEAAPSFLQSYRIVPCRPAPVRMKSTQALRSPVNRAARPSGSPQRPVDLLHRVQAEVAARDVRLIADHEQHVTGFAKPAEIRLRRGKDPQLGNRARCRGISALHPDLIQHPVPVEEDGGASGVAHVFVEHSG